MRTLQSFISGLFVINIYVYHAVEAHGRTPLASRRRKPRPPDKKQAPNLLTADTLSPSQSHQHSVSRTQKVL